jgi:hypothetical protein
MTSGIFRTSKGTIHLRGKGLVSLLGLETRTYRLSIKADTYGGIEKEIQSINGEIKKIDFALPTFPHHLDLIKSESQKGDPSGVKP